MAKKPKFQTVKGMHDILPEDQKYYRKIYEVGSKIAEFYGFKKIDTPIIEDADLFIRGVGSATDIVKKEMFTFRTKGGENVALRPEGTASILRAYFQHGMHTLPQPVKLWYFGPFFRYEKPQADRYRQFWQFGIEVLGESSPIIDAQVILISYNILKELKFKDIVVNINTIGCRQCRPYYKKLLTSYFKSRVSSLCPDCRRRLQENVLRILDCKQEKCQPIKAQAPQILDHLCDECKEHFKSVLEFLDGVEIPYNLDPYLVRGLDYYTRTVFELSIKDSGEISQTALGGGGRYDLLGKIIGPKEVPACGTALGVERIIKLIKEKEIKIPEEKECQVFLIQLGDLARIKSLKLLEEFRKARINVGESLGKGGMRAQLSRANQLKAKYALILGQKEAVDGIIIIKNMENGKQETVKMEKVIEVIKKKLSTNRKK